MMHGRNIANFARAATLLLAVAVLAAHTLPVAAQSSRVFPDGSSSSQVAVESKSRLIERQLAQSPGVQRIRQSGNGPATKLLAEAERLFGKAQSEIAAGKSDAARRLLDDALRQIVAASRLVPDAAQQEEQLRIRNAELREAITTFKSLHGSISARMDTRKSQSAGLSAAEINKIDGILAKTDALSSQGRHQDANLLLVDAHKVVVSTLNRMLAAETIVYDLKFNSPAEEYRHELARNHSYEELIPIALAQLNSTMESAAQAERFTQQSRSLRDAAQRKADGGDYFVAVKTMQDATEHLQRSLRAAGVFVPQSLENSK
jgi:hypothetical protein